MYVSKIIENPYAMTAFGTMLETVYWKAFFGVLIIMVGIFLAIMSYFLIKKVGTNQKKKKLTATDIRTAFSLTYEKSKKQFLKLHYLLIWAFLQLTKRKLIEILFLLIGSRGIQEGLSPQRISDPEMNLLLGKRSSFTLLIFMVPPYLISFCFGNKFVRNLGILIYILGIWFLFFGFFLDLGLFVV